MGLAQAAFQFANTLALFFVRLERGISAGQRGYRRFLGLIFPAIIKGGGDLMAARGLGNVAALQNPRSRWRTSLRRFSVPAVFLASRLLAEARIITYDPVQFHRGALQEQWHGEQRYALGDLPNHDYRHVHGRIGESGAHDRRNIDSSVNLSNHNTTLVRQDSVVWQSTKSAMSPDLVAAYVTGPINEQSGGVAVFLGNGSGFASPILTPIKAGIPFYAAAADFNGDGKQDLAVADYSVIAILLGKGDGTFQPEVDYSGGGSYSIQITDFNGDGKPDLIAWGAPNQRDAFSVLLGNGDGTFGFAQTTNDANEITSVAAADLNNDGKADVVVGDAGGVAVFLGNGNGTFQAPVYYATTFDKQYVAIGDFNGDGIPDIVFAGGIFNAGTGLTTGVVGVLLGNGDGTFQARSRWIFLWHCCSRRWQI